MENTSHLQEMFEAVLKRIQCNGIKADRRHLKMNMYTQFADPFEFAREYVVNSYDAMATACYISGRETQKTVTITIRDNGRGMDHDRLEDYFKIFRSRKDDGGNKAIGHFGVGKMSVAAVPGLLLFAGITSTGNECWRFETDSLIEDRKIILERIEPVPERGTKFEITIKKTASLGDTLARIHEILYRYVRHLDIDVYFDLPEVDQQHNPVRKILIRGNWVFDPENLGRCYSIHLDGVRTEVIMGLGNPNHEIYQNRVYITSKYNLLSTGAKEIPIPNLKIRVDSEIFQLTFGRHCLGNENVIYQLSYHLRKHILPQYFDYLRSLISEEFIISCPDLVEKIGEMACGLIEFFPGGYSWNTFPIFRVHSGPRLSFKGLAEETDKYGILYLEAQDNEGADYSIFTGPVLKIELEVIQKVFARYFVDLNTSDVVIEAPSNSGFSLTPEEKHFESYLVFKPKGEVLDQIMNKLRPAGKGVSAFSLEQIARLEDAIGICEEAKIAERDFSSIVWKVNFLVERDGKTPCRSRKFLYREGKIILNLHHHEIRDFVDLSCMSPELSAHWALAMCLSDMKLISHITPDAREDLLLIDAMGRLDFGSGSQFINEPKKKLTLIDFLRGCSS
jgi:hypothetical protein